MNIFYSPADIDIDIEYIPRRWDMIINTFAVDIDPPVVSADYSCKTSSWKHLRPDHYIHIDIHRCRRFFAHIHADIDPLYPRPAHIRYKR